MSRPKRAPVRTASPFCRSVAAHPMTAKTWSMSEIIPNSFLRAARTRSAPFAAPASASAHWTALKSPCAFHAIGSTIGEASRQVSTAWRRNCIPSVDDGDYSISVLFKIGAENGHLKIVRALVVLIVDEQHANELVAHIDLGRIFFLRPRHHADTGIAEQLF